MSLRLRTAIIALGLGALACSGEVPTSPDAITTTEPAYAKTPVQVTCTYYYSAFYAMWATNVSWSGYSVFSYHFHDGVHTSNDYTLNKPTRRYSAPAFYDVWPATQVDLVRKNGVVVKTQACTEQQPS